MDWNDDLRARSAELRSRSARLRADIAALRLECARISARSDAMRQVPPTAGHAPPTQPADSHDAALGALRDIREMLDTFPLEWQIAMVKALTARTIVKAHEHAQPPAVLSA